MKDQHLVEIEIAQAAAARVVEWAKLFGYFIALPLGILVIVLTILGFQQYSDFVGLVESRRKDPRIGRGFPGAPAGYLRNLDNDRVFDAGTDTLQPLSHGEIWGGALWRIRQALGARSTDRLVASTWKALTTADLNANTGVARRIVATASTLGPEAQATVRSILEKRGLKL